MAQFFLWNNSNKTHINCLYLPIALRYPTFHFHGWIVKVAPAPWQPPVRARAYLVIIVSQGSAQLVVVHVCFVFPESPQLGHFFCFEELEFTIVGGPADQVLMFLVQQQLQQELPQRDCTLHTWGGRGRVSAGARSGGVGGSGWAPQHLPLPPVNLIKSCFHFHPNRPLWIRCLLAAFL